MADTSILPYDFNKIIHYDNINTSISNFTGYTVNTKDKSIKLNISDLDNVNKGSKKEELLDILKNAKRAGEKVTKLESNINSLKDTTQKIQKSLDAPIHNANDKPIIGGIGQNSGIDYRGLYSHELGNPNKGIRITNGMIGYYRNGDKEFQPIITSDGLVVDDIPLIFDDKKNSKAANANTGSQGDNKNNKGESSSNGGSSGGGGNGSTTIVNKKIKYIDLPCKLIRNSSKQVVEIDYFKDGELEYKETINRDEVSNKVTSIVLEHIEKETETTILVRDEDSVVTDINVSYTNEDPDFEYIGMK